ncbi:unnamed protein product [Rotaria sordida]|uniref:Aminoglycoside phosphotransferase domain-containing protein n=1 Tax=Rotaria sordida TaxID=392033 RepID=A0A814L3V0_9BILA|nr:unnamed protein product [Rotaria sordida]CAF1059858.1 unnamed protein product [Rotaria sordida]CAF1230205.1 unnamed protein product [Rotaria sordida]CAF3613004.1 unnamed protein product [Rotaria sordida]
MDFAVSKFEFYDILQTEYGFDDIISVNTLPGGYIEEETWLVCLKLNRKYVVKIIDYRFNIDHLKTILNFQNYLYSNLNYPCSLIVSTLSSKLVVQIDNDHYLFIQTFLDGHVPSLIELDESYLMKMGTLLGQWRLASRTFMSIIPSTNIEKRELTDQWWIEQFDRLSLCKHLEKIDIDYLRLILFECRERLNGKIDQLEQGLIHNDFQPSNTLCTNDDRQVYVIDFGEACYAPLIVDLATALFLLLTNGIDDDKRLNIFLVSYQNLIRLDRHEIELLDIVVRLKLTTNFIGDCANVKSKEEYDHSSWLQSCSKWIDILHQEKRNLFQTMLCNK